MGAKGGGGSVLQANAPAAISSSIIMGNLHIEMQS